MEIESTADAECFRTVLQDYIDQEAKAQSHQCGRATIRVEVTQTIVTGMIERSFIHVNGSIWLGETTARRISVQESELLGQVRRRDIWRETKGQEVLCP